MTNTASHRQETALLERTKKAWLSPEPEEEYTFPEHHQQMTQIQRQTGPSHSTVVRQHATTIIISSSRCQDKETKYLKSIRQMSVLF